MAMIVAQSQICEDYCLMTKSYIMNAAQAYHYGAVEGMRLIIESQSASILIYLLRMKLNINPWRTLYLAMGISNTIAIAELSGSNNTIISYLLKMAEHGKLESEDIESLMIMGIL